MNPTVYLVDDDPVCLIPMEMLIKKFGYECHAFTGGQELLDAAVAGGSAIVLSDLRMPEISGLDLFTRLRERGIEHPFFLVSGHADPDIIKESMSLGVSGFLSKPVSKQELQEVLALTLGTGAKSD